LVLATKRAVGSEYGYPVQQQITKPEPKVKTRTRKRPAPAVGIAVIAIFFIIGISYTFLQAAKAHLIWQVNQAKEANAAIQMDNEKLKLEVARMKSLDRIEAIAVNQLQMVQNPSVVYLSYQSQQGDSTQTPANLAAQADDNSAPADVAAKNKLIETIAAVINKGVMDKG